MSSSAAWPELLFTVPAIIGFLVNWFTFNDAVADLHYLQALNVGEMDDDELREYRAREIVARGSCRTEFIRTAIQVMFMVLGFYLLTVAPIDPEQPTPVAALVVSIVILIAEFLMVVKSIMDRRDRHAVIRILSGRKRMTSR